MVRSIGDYMVKNSDKLLTFKMRRRLVKLEILHRDDERRRGGSNILVVDIFGNKRAVTRTELTSRYRDFAGNNFKLRKMRTGRRYRGYDNSEGEFKGIRVSDKVHKYSGYKKGTYIMLKVNVNGEIDSSRVYNIREKEFKKMFSIDTVDRSREFDSNIKSSIDTRLIDKVGLEESEEFKEEKVFRNIKEREGKGMERVGSGKSEVEKIEVIFKLENSDGLLVGFVIKKGLHKKKISLSQLKNLCRNKLLSNVELVEQDNGKSYLRGNGIRLSELPVKRIK